jgi:hypothetical protein
MASVSGPATHKPKPPVVQPGTGNNIIINPNQVGTLSNVSINSLTLLQRLNPVLECIRNVGKEFGDIIPDFQVGRTTCVLYLRCSSFCITLILCTSNIHLSLKYHRLHPEYIHTRIEKLGHAYNLRILLIMCDVVSSVRAPDPNSLNSFTRRASIRSQSGSLPRSVLSRELPILSFMETYKGLPHQQYHYYRRVEVPISLPSWFGDYMTLLQQRRSWAVHLHIQTVRAQATRSHQGACG